MSSWSSTLGVFQSSARSRGGFYVGSLRGGRGGSQSSVTISNVTKTFFRPELIRDPILKARQRVLSRFGMFVMKDARQSLRHRKNASKVGRPPTSWKNKKDSNHNDLLRRFLYYSFDPPNNVVIGPVPLDGPIAKKRIPQVLEYGGDTLNRDRFGEPITSTIAPRPYMRPAFDRQVKKRMPMDFEGCIRK